MSFLDISIPVAEAIPRGLYKYRSEKQIRHLIGDKPALTVREVLALPTDLYGRFCIVMFPVIVPGEILHYIAAALAEYEVDRLSAQGVYVDFRTRRLLQAKVLWAGNQSSLGAYRAARSGALAARHTVIELADAQVTYLVSVCEAAGNEDPRKAVMDTLNLVLKGNKQRQATAVELNAIAHRILGNNDEA